MLVLYIMYLRAQSRAQAVTQQELSQVQQPRFLSILSNPG